MEENQYVFCSRITNYDSRILGDDDNDDDVDNDDDSNIKTMCAALCLGYLYMLATEALWLVRYICIILTVIMLAAPVMFQRIHCGS